jgi:hypothetical protein
MQYVELQQRHVAVSNSIPVCFLSLLQALSSASVTPSIGLTHSLTQAAPGSAAAQQVQASVAISLVGCGAMQLSDISSASGGAQQPAWLFRKQSGNTQQMLLTC